MKKTVIRIAIIAAVCLVVLLVVASFFLGSIIKKGVETVGPHITKTEMKLDSAYLSLLRGSGSLKGFLLGNPEGFKAESAIKVGKVSVGVRAGSVLSDKIHITHVHVVAPDITFEAPGLNLKANNLSKILENVQAVTGGAGTNKAAAKDTGASKKMQIDDFLLSGAKIHIKTGLTAGKAITVPLPDIHLTDLGKGAGGVTPAEVTEMLLKEIVNGTLVAVEKAVADVGKAAAGAVQDAGKAAGDSVDKAAKGLKGLFGK